ncbi:MAG: amidohydrolase [Caulobacteraceae bacterium]|nr:amidohydrolase [Caulobacteraceae bacterium]
MWRGFKLISDDSHFEGSPDQWRSYVPKEFQAYMPRIVKLPNGGDAWETPGDPPTRMGLGLNLAMGRGWENLKVSGISYDEPGIVGTGDGQQRLLEMDRDGIDAEVIYTPVGRGFRTAPTEASHAIAQAYNNWLSKEYCAPDPNRLLGLGMLPSGSVENAVAELKRIKGMPGIYGVHLHEWPAGGLGPSPEDDIFWQAAVETGVPLTVHIRFGGGVEADRPRIDPTSGPMAPINTMLTKIAYPTAYCMTQLITNRVFDRFPSLRISFAECGASWVPFYAESADTNYFRHRHWAQIALDHEPSHYIRRNFLFGMQDDYAAIKIRDLIGVDNLTWGTDFPHVACDWPHSDRVLEKMFAGVPAEDIRKIVGGNLARHLGLDPAKAAARPVPIAAE